MTAATVDAYLAAETAERRAVLEDLRRTVREAAPDATETIAYGMPALRTAEGRFLVSYAAYRAHFSLFPASASIVEALGEEARRYVAGRGTFRFPADRPIPLDLVRRVVAARAAELRAR